MSAAETELTSKGFFLEDNSAGMQSSRQNIEALKIQIQKEKDDYLEKNVGDSEDAKAKDFISSYQWLKLDAEFKMTEYKTSLEAYESSRIDALRQSNYLVEIAKPTLPDSAKYPRVLYNLLTLFLLLSLFYAIGRMVITIIIEHR